MVVKTSLILDSSAFINLARIDVLEILSKYFNFIVCSKVEDELLSSLDLTIYTPKDILVFRKLVKHKKLSIRDPKVIVPSLINILQKDSGELYSIALALETKFILLIDDFKPYKYCVYNQIEVYNTIEIILLLLDLKEINKKECFQKIIFLKNAIKKDFLLRVLDYLNM